jgi:hypothetical protein
MVPEHWEEYYERSKRFSDRGLHVTLKPQSDPTASFVVDGYTKTQKEILQNESVQGAYQVALYDDAGVEYWIDQAERLNAFGFNKFKGWMCKLFKGPMPCITPSCVSSADSKIPKEKNV